MRTAYKYLVTILILMIALGNLNTYSANQDDKHFYFEINYDSINIQLMVQRLMIRKNDSLEFHIFINNQSKDTLAKFEDFYFSYTESVEYGRNLMIVYGGLFESGLEYEVKMKKVEPNSSDSITGWLTCKYLLDNNINECFSTLLSLGFIRSFEKIKQNEHLGNIKTVYLPDNKVVVSSLVVEASLDRLETDTFNIKFKK